MRDDDPVTCTALVRLGFGQAKAASRAAVETLRALADCVLHAELRVSGAALAYRLCCPCRAATEILNHLADGRLLIVVLFDPLAKLLDFPLEIQHPEELLL